ncbi:ComF family protein [Candidatus Accumulibacter sp. ACC003]|uniref:ComF family protein n=1 Tax=Candidatus Accumulibacter sp. ACC003 TaxID=2823334 RepID=UPI0025C55115|nr:ComF family protein [Candidatus Accumulibacter sp. ACC003]
MPILTQTARLVRSSCARLLTQDCLLCAAVSGSRVICPACEAELPRLPEARCRRCALPTANGESCGRCLAKPPHYDLTLAAFRYDFPLDKLIQSFKYGHRLVLGDYFGQQLAALAAASQADLIVPLPLHPSRLRGRGFNQALELARPVSKAWRTPIDARSCRRIRHTAAQADLPWRERAKNVRGAFHCEADFTGQRLLLVDDVMTTGASLNELALTVKRCGAAQVTLLVLARALPFS